MEVTKKVRYVGLEAIVKRADGTEEDLGIIGQWYDPKYWNKKLRKKLGLNPADVVATTGKAIITALLVSGSTRPQYIGWGTGAGTSAVGNTTLFTEAYSTSNDGVHNTRVTGTLSQQTTSTTNDSYRVVGTLTAAAGNSPITVTNYGIFDTNGQAADLVTAPSGGNLFVKSDFTGIALNAGDSIQFTATLQFS